jgi:Glycosyl transferase family 11
MRFALSATILSNGPTVGRWLDHHLEIVDFVILHVDDHTALPSMVEAVADRRGVLVWPGSQVVAFDQTISNLIARQAINIEQAIDWCRHNGVDVIVQNIDADELLCATRDQFETMFADGQLGSVTMRNHEAVPLQDPFEGPVDIKLHGQMLSWPPDAGDFYLSYANGKSAARITPDLRSSGPHRFAGTTGAHLHYPRLPYVLHAPFPDVASWQAKFANLGYFSETWEASPEHTNTQRFYHRSRQALADGDDGTALLRDAAAQVANHDLWLRATGALATADPLTGDFAHGYLEGGWGEHSIGLGSRSQMWVWPAALSSQQTTRATTDDDLLIEHVVALATKLPLDNYTEWTTLFIEEIDASGHGDTEWPPIDETHDAVAIVPLVDPSETECTGTLRLFTDDQWLGVPGLQAGSVLLVPAGTRVATSATAPGVPNQFRRIALTSTVPVRHVDENAITVVLSDGLGNQMFQYALGLQLAHQHHVPLQLNTTKLVGHELRQFQLDRLSITAAIDSSTPPNTVTLPAPSADGGVVAMARVAEQSHAFDPQVLDSGPHTSVEGFWQSESYFADIADTVRREFQLVEPLAPSRRQVAARIADGRAVSVHVRRGDYVEDPLTHAAHGTPSVAWYRAAVVQIQQRVPDASLFVFSDDVAWCREHLDLGGPLEFVDRQSDGHDWEDLHLMASCDHHIIANSTFSWWGAWLNPSPNKIVIAPARWFASPLRDGRDVIPPSWLKLDEP